MGCGWDWGLRIGIGIDSDGYGVGAEAGHGAGADAGTQSPPQKVQQLRLPGAAAHIYIAHLVQWQKERVPM